MAVRFDLLLGSPGETHESVRAALDRMRSLDPEAVGVALGLRLYRGTRLGDELAPVKGPVRPGVTGATADLMRPAFYISPALGDDAGEWLAGEIAGDGRFLYFGAAGAAGVDVEGVADVESAAGVEGAANYNYNANAELERAIAEGERGAYWDILRLRDHPPGQALQR